MRAYKAYGYGGKQYLSGGQTKLDKNNDGKISGEDFELLRKLREYMNGGKMYERGGKNGDPEAPEGAEKGPLFYDKDSQGFYEVMPAGNVQRVETADRLMRSAPREAFGFVTREGSGNAALDEFLDKYADVAPTMGGEEGDDQTGQGYRSSVKKALTQALRTGDAALMSALLNPNGGSGAIMGVEPADFEGAGFRSMYRPSGAAPTSLINVGDGELSRIQAGTATEDGYQMRRPNIRDVMRMLERE